MKKMLSLEEIESQMALELPTRELMTMNDFTNGAAASARNSCTGFAGGPASIIDIGACVGIQQAIDTSSAFQTIS